MPVLAVPYLVPFANAAGIVIGSVATAVGLSALSDKVQDYMEENPENSMKILAMIMPEQGIAALFNKEAGDEVEGEGEEVEEEVEVKDTRTKKEIVLDAVRKAKRGKGNYASPDAEGNWVSGRGSVIRGLEDAGKVDKGLSKKPYKKSKFNWKRFTRNKADGGRVGFKKGGWDPGAGRDTKGYQKTSPHYSGGDGNKGPIEKLNISPAIETKSSALGSHVPTGKVGLTSLSKLGNIKAMIDLRNLIEGQDLESEITYENQWGPLTLGGKFDTEGNKNLGVEFNKGNFTVRGYTDLDDVNQLGLTYRKTLNEDKFRKADGGRIGFEVGGLSSRAQSIYDSWIAAGHTEEDVLAYLISQGLYGDQEATGIETIVNTAPTVGGGDGDFKGGGKWGNLDLSKSKTFNKNVFKTVGPVKGWDMTEIEGFYNPKTGQYQTLEGQNIEHGGYFTGEPKEGDIEGTPIDWSSIPMGAFGLGMKAFKGIQNAWQKKQAEGILEAAAERQAKAIELHEAKQAQKAADAAAGAFTNTVQLDPGGGGGPGSPGSWHGQTAAKERQGQQVAGPGFGQGAYFDKGGLATMFQRRR